MYIAGLDECGLCTHCTIPGTNPEVDYNQIYVTVLGINDGFCYPGIA